MGRSRIRRRPQLVQGGPNMALAASANRRDPMTLSRAMVVARADLAKT
jgi:hypothetical protein